MSEAGKPTPGVWTTRRDGFGECAVMAGNVWITYSSGNEWTEIKEREANAALIAEAGTVHHETGLTPRQLLAQRDALAKALLDCADMLERIMNGSDWGAIEEEIIDARAALALVKGETK